jgi:hypothetical protein
VSSRDDAALVTDDVMMALAAVTPVVDTFALDHQVGLDALTQHQRNELLVRVALTFLVDQGLASVAPEGAFDRPLPMRLGQPHAEHIKNVVVDRMQRRPGSRLVARS